MFIKNAWYVAGWSSEVKGDALLARKLLKETVVLYRGEDGKIVALEDRCSHRHAPLSCGQREGNRVRCMYHGLVFDPTGKCVEIPSQERISEKMKVRSYPMVERDKLIWLWPGDPALADPSLIHAVESHESPEWQARVGGYIHYDANCQLIADNLLDFSHLAFVHNKSIGTRALANQRPVVEILDNALRIKHWTPGVPRPPFAGKISKLPETIDRSLIYTWHVKGNLFDQTSVMSSMGTGEHESKEPTPVRLRTLIALTPETDTSSHYFWSTAHNTFLPEVERVTDVLWDQVASAFAEDREMIEAQQKVINADPTRPMQGIAADGSLMRVRRIVEQLIAKERGEQPSSHVPGAQHVPLARSGVEAP